MALSPRKFPRFGLPVDDMPDELFPDTIMSWDGTPFTVRERTMMALMERITDKPEWERKVFDEGIVEKWRVEAMEGEMDVTEKMFVWIISEIRDKSKYYEEDGMVGTLDLNAAVVKSDTAIPSELAESLRQACRRLEDVPEKDKDWHPGSGEKVLDLVHPSLFPLIYGRSKVLSDGDMDINSCLDYIGKGETIPIPGNSEIGINPYNAGVQDSNSQTNYWSKNFQWLPCQVEFARPEGVRITSYINNLHPVSHAGLYSVIERCIARSIPLWERTLSSVLDTYEIDKKPRVEMEHCDYDYPQGREMPEDYREDTGENKYERKDQWLKNTRVLVMPEPGEYEHWKQPGKVKVDLRGQFSERGLQVIVKLANIHLTSEQPEYEGGSWHIEGQLNEHICASALYYYDSDNITESFLAFRQKTNDDGREISNKAYDQDDYEGFEQIYDISQDGPTVQELGRISTRQNRLLAFPNVLQHRVSPFRLQDPTRPGHRKLLALFLVDPHLSILSTVNVPPQQREWWSRKLREEKSLSMLPPELAEQVLEGVEGFPISLEEAKGFREGLMKERRAFVGDVESVFADSTFNFCEH